MKVNVKVGVGVMGVGEAVNVGVSVISVEVTATAGVGEIEAKVGAVGTEVAAGPPTTTFTGIELVTIPAEFWAWTSNV